jgi:hypothetical protein
MVSINMAALDSDLKDDVVVFLLGKLPVTSDKDGDVISFEDKSPRTHVTSPEIRTYMKRYLHSKDMKKQFRVLSEDGSLTFVKKQAETEEEEEEKKAKKSEASSSKGGKEDKE